MKICHEDECAELIMSIVEYVANDLFIVESEINCSTFSFQIVTVS